MIRLLHHRCAGLAMVSAFKRALEDIIRTASVDRCPALVERIRERFYDLTMTTTHRRYCR